MHALQVHTGFSCQRRRPFVVLVESFWFWFKVFGFIFKFPHPFGFPFPFPLPFPAPLPARPCTTVAREAICACNEASVEIVGEAEAMGGRKRTDGQNRGAGGQPEGEKERAKKL